MSYLHLLAFGARMRVKSRLDRQRLTVGISLFLVFLQLLSAVGMASLAILQPPAMAGLFGTPRAAFAAANVSGYVFRDFDSDGSKDTNETYGLANVTVSAYNSAGTVVATAISTAPAGAYTLNLSALANNTPLRIEFTNLASGYQSSFQGGTNVQFVTTSASALTINYAVNQPCDFCQAVPNLAVSRYNNGNPLASPAGTAATLPALLKFPYNSSTTTTPSTITTGNKIGAIWGLAYQRSSRKLFASAIQRRHVGFGPLGTGGLYMIDTTTNAVTNFMDINALPGVDTGTDPHVGLPNGSVAPSNDAASFDAVGKLALGDVEISDDEKTLWVTNLKDRTLLEIPIGNPPVAPTTVGSGANDVKVHPLPTPTCTSGLFRAWAVEFNEGKVFIGGLCTAESGGTQANMTAYVYSHLPTAAVGSFTLVTSFALNYARGCAFDTNGAGAGGASDCDGWEVWQSNWAVPEAPVSSTPAGAPFSFWSKPQPIFSDLEFDDDGSLIIGMLDRWGLQTGANNYGTAGTTLYNGTTAADLLRICNVSGSYQFQGTGSCPAPNVETSNAAINEHYKDPGPLSAPFHPESTHGALAFKPGSGEVATTFLDAFSTWRQSVVWFTNASGAPQTTHGVDIVTGSNGDTSGAQGKATGLGDMELLCDPAPIQVGNRVWKDSDGDGIQDANESGFAAIQVQLVQGVSVVATTTTDANGNYYFSNLTPNTAYTVRILTTQSVLTGWGNSPANASDGAHAANSSNSAFTDTVDSDYSVSGSNANITFTTGAAGFNNHSFDFGFTPPVPPVIDLNVRKSSSANGGPVVAGDTITYTMVITSSSAITQTGLSISDTLPAGTSYVPNSLRVTGYYTFTARDDFSAGANYSGGSGWSSNWVEENDDGSPTTGKIFAFLSCPTLNSNCLAFEANPTIANTIRRDVDLSNSITATFSVVGVGNPPVRTVTLAMADSTGSVVQQTLGQLTSSTLQTISVGIPSQFYISTARLRATGAAGAVSYNLTDNYLISGVKITTTAPATGLPAILSVPNNFFINSQYPMTVTYAVVVNTPVPASVGAIVNTVAVTSTVNTLAKTSTVTDTLSGQKIGNYVWLDTNQDGIQDSSDQPLSGVQVWLTDLSGNILSTTTTSATGEYYFIAPTLGAGVAYQVMLPLTQTALLNYQPTVQDAGTNDAADSDGNATMIADRLLIQLTSPTPGNYNFTYDFGFIPRIFDWGDLPEPKFNTDITGTVGARHEIVDGLRIGNSVDSENSGQPNSTATGDGSDEDGVAIPALAPGASSVVQVIVQNTLAASATLYGFIDFNNDGTFSASETVTALVPSGTTGLIPLTFNVPGGSPTGVDIGARFRLSSDTTLGADGPTLSQLAPNGEVEDYIIRLVNPIDMGDLPSIYSSLAISNGPSHILVAGLLLGSLEDIDTNGSPDSLATGDDELPVPGVSDDEDGIDFGTFQPGMPAVVTVTVQSNNASAVVYGFIDFNGDGDFSDVGERQQIATPSTGSYLLTFTVPTTATLFSPIGARFRLSSDSAAAQPTGAAINGEVEDYLIAVNTPLDFGDLPDPADGSGVLDYNTRLYDGGANHPMIPGLQMGAAIDAEEEGQPNSLAAGDDISPTVGTDDEDGVTFTEFNPGAQAALTVTAINTTGLAAILYAFVDFNNNGYLTDTGELLTVTVPGSTNVLTPFVLTYTVPTTATTYTPLGARFRLSTDSAMGPNGLATNGEVEDYLVQVVNRGNLVVQKQVIWGLNPSEPTRQFTVTVEGPSYPSGQSASLSDGQLITFSNVALGVYTVTETLPGSGWVVSYSVPSGSLNLSTTTGLTQTLYITNTPPPPFASLQIAKLVTGGPNVTATFAVSLTGASGFSNSYGVSTSAATVITQLLQGAYTVTEQLATLPLPPFGYTWTTTSYTPTNGQITLTAGQTSYLTVTNALTLTIQRFGDRLWLESDSDGIASTNFVGPVANQVLTATNASGTVYTTTTDSNGLYTFTVPAGTYSVTYGLPPIGYQASSSPGGSLISATSGGNDTSHANNSVVTLNPSDVITTVDFGFNLIPVPHLMVSKTANKSVVRAGDLVTYTITLINDGSGAANAVTVHDSLPTSVSYVSHSTSHGLFSVITGDWTIPVVPVGSETLTVTVQIR